MMPREIRPDIYFLGVKHTKNGSLPHNYRPVKRFFDDHHISYVTLELRLHNEPAFRTLGKRLFTDPVEALADVDQQAMDEPSYGGEYIAAIVHCRQKRKPLYLIDMWDSPPEEVATTNVLALANPEEIWDDHREIPSEHVGKVFILSERNKYMARALQLTTQNHQGETGTHVGGMDHFRRKWLGAPLQEQIRHKRIKVIEIKPGETSSRQ